MLGSGGSLSQPLSSLDHTGQRRRVDAMEDVGSPEIIQELLDTNSEWTNIQDIVKLTFKGIYQTLKVQNDCIRDIEQILPAKADSHQVRAQLAQKANLNDMKKTMAEVAENLESKPTHIDTKRMLDQKCDRQEMTYMLQQKISWEDMKTFFES